LMQNYPNPATVNTSMSFVLPGPMVVNLSIYDIVGRKKDILADGLFPAGTHTIPLNINGFSSGIYFYRLSAGNHQKIKKMVVK